MSSVAPEAVDRALLAGDLGDAPRLAMRLLLHLAEIANADRFIDITSAHIDSCLYHGQAGLDFAERLVRAGGRTAVPATLNVSSLDLLHPQWFRGSAELAMQAKRLMDAYTALGCQPTWTCAPYQLPRRPQFGEHVAWAESNAIVFANSVLGARTDRYGDFTDICAAITGRVPRAGLHCTENRAGQALFRVSPSMGVRLFDEDTFYAVLGHLVGRQCGSRIPVITGLPAGLSEDRLKALGAAAASAGAVAMFHAVGSTPEAPTLAAATRDNTTVSMTLDVDRAAILAAREELTTSANGPLISVSVGTPHFSFAEFARLAPLMDGRPIAGNIDFYVNTGRDTLARAREAGLVQPLERAGVRIVTDTCTYITPILRRTDGVVMTNSAKWAYYAPGNLGVEVAFGTLEECVRSAQLGRITRDESLWHA
jgi:predicted aconitase